MFQTNIIIGVLINNLSLNRFKIKCQSAVPLLQTLFSDPWSFHWSHWSHIRLISPVSVECPPPPPPPVTRLPTTKRATLTATTARRWNRGHIPSWSEVITGRRNRQWHEPTGTASITRVLIHPKRRSTSLLRAKTRWHGAHSPRGTMAQVCWRS